MSVFQLDERIVFPDPELAEADGLIAVGGDLNPERLIAAYKAGIFPWFIEKKIPYWFSPNPRCILMPEDLHVSHSMRQLMKKDYFTVTFDQDFEYIIKHCAAAKRNDKGGSWINKDFKKAYTELHNTGYAHSVEVWKQDIIVGGLYGVSLGRCFFGESMFSAESNASKYALICLTEKLKEHHFTMIDCQVYNPHLESLGAKEIMRIDFLRELKKALHYKTIKGNWENL